MSGEPLIVLANRHAGSHGPDGGSALERFAREAGLEPRVFYTRGPQHLKRLLREQVLGRHDRVAVAGGDGTVHPAIQLLAGTGVTLGILPLGTANNFAKALRLPGDLPSALRVIAAGKTRAVDLGLAGDEYFSEAAGVGIFADVLSMTRASHRLTSIARAMRVILRWVITNHAPRVALVLDGEPRAGEIINVTIANSFAVGYNLPIAPTAEVTDARLDVVVVSALTRREMLSYWRAVRSQSHLDLPKVTVYRAREVRVTARHRLAVHVDDRSRWRTPITMRVAPAALRVFVDVEPGPGPDPAELAAAAAAREAPAGG